VAVVAVAVAAAATKPSYYAICDKSPVMGLFLLLNAYIAEIMSDGKTVKS
jgi:hypothetical protein